MKPFDDLLARARRDPRHIVLPEGEDLRVVEGGLRAVREGIARVTFLGDAERVRELLREETPSAAVIDPATSPDLDRFAAEHHERRRHKGMDAATALGLMRQPLYFGAMMVRLGQAEGSVAGAASTTADTVRAALQVIGTDLRYSLVSSFFVMMLCEEHHDDLKGAMIFADCGLVVNPSAKELAQIALASADSARSLLGMEPRVAMLSFSTSGSARHALVDKVVAATRVASGQRPDLLIEGDVQLDAGILPEISARKVLNSRVKGRANVLIFPNLEAGNIGYKLAERMGRAKAIGPVLQGLALPANDLSRGCTAEDVFRLIAVTVVQAQAAAAGRLLSPDRNTSVASTTNIQTG
jgi:phosphate acetyltransferase